MAQKTSKPSKATDDAKPQQPKPDEKKCYNCDEMVTPDERGRCPICTGYV